MLRIYNELLEISIAPKGAELQSIYNKQTNLEYLWDGNPNFWAKRSPVLFPIVGTLNHNQYRYKGKTYDLGRHGFARDMVFTPTYHSHESICFSLVSSEDTFSKYPFRFIFSIRYSLSANKLKVEYFIENRDRENMCFSVGAHPAFKVPLVDQTVFEDYYLEFPELENAGRYPLSAEGLIEKEPVPFFENTRRLNLQPSLFYEDALVFKALKSQSISLVSDKTPHGLKMSFENFPYMGFWNARDADFVCIEPWCGIADTVGFSGELEEKEGINKLQPEESFSRNWQVEFF